MIEIRPYTNITAEELNQLTGPSSSTVTYPIDYHDDATGSGFTLKRIVLETPHVHQYTHIDDEWVRTYLAPADFAFGAYDGEQLVGALIAEKRNWNDSLWVWEFHVAAERRGQGIGRMLMEHAAEQAKEAGLWVIICETQNRNGSAIDAYRKLGFRLEGVDISYYSKEDFPDRDVAVFMKRRL